MAVADVPGSRPDGVEDGLEAALDALADAYADAVGAITAAADAQTAFAGADRVGDVLRELGEDLATRRARLAAEVRRRLIQSAVR
ncbi:hypothetical protein [Nonomuraea lactucae]|uniref:hypothetical protein n=1 Tax=Nonomuraea lactucae TaxID=2249762 RepID=UPI0013B40CC0|nr:hypothetical protein [Nonomuraea lactucae]